MQIWIRRYSSRALVLLLLVVAGMSRSAVADPAKEMMPIGDATTPYRTTTLSNGLDVIVIEDKTVPLVTIDITVRNGAFTEPDEFAGLSHLYEHMFFKANAVIPTQEQFMKRI